MKFLLKIKDKGKKLFDWFVGLRHVMTIIILLIIQIALMALMKFVFGWFDTVKNPITIAVAMYTWGITLITTWLIGMKSMNYLMSRVYKSEHLKEFDVERRHMQDLEELQIQRDELNIKINELEGKLVEKDNEIETMKQIQQLVTNYESSEQLQLFTVSKSGYIVKEEALYPLKNIKELSENFPGTYGDRMGFGREIKADDNWRVFYSDNKLYKYGVGIKLEQLYFATKLNIIYLKGIKFSRLARHDEDCKGYNPEVNVANHVWIVKRDKKNKYTIINKQQHNDFKEHYRGYQQDIAGQAIQRAIDNSCESLTERLHEVLETRYGGRIKFVNDNEDIENLRWQPLTEGLRTNSYLQIFMNDLYLTFKAMQLCANNNQQLDNALIAQQANANFLN